jgi:hypothetical protein
MIACGKGELRQEVPVRDRLLLTLQSGAKAKLGELTRFFTLEELLK